MIQIDMPMPVNCYYCRFCETEYTDENDPHSYAYCCAAEKHIADACDGTDKIVLTAIIQKQRWCPLKSQEPRVMTLEEVKQWCEIHPHKQDPIWVEFQHGYGTDGWRAGLINSGLPAWCKDNEARCWTSRPTDAQREAIPWN